MLEVDYEDEYSDHRYYERKTLLELEDEIYFYRGIYKSTIEYQNKKSEDKELNCIRKRIRNAYIDLMKLEERKDLMKFIKKYKYLSGERLAKAIFRESEYWHGIK